MRFGRVMTVVMMAGALAACGGDEDDPMGGGHGTPVDAALYQGGVRMDEPIELVVGTVMRLEVRFLDDDGEEIHDLLPSHTSALTFAPTAIAEATADFDDAFFFDVQVNGDIDDSGSVSVGYGHGEIEQTFGPFDVVVVD